ncbi:MAG: membrane lipoprotein lipid attachment site-containing protein [Deltaproteobacteria bacterium]|nr:membrane lipoprotein lipid attachment site-containing protein [Deltaproteobacteria bacterium]
MKRLFLVLTAVLFLAGCGAAARESGFYEHDSMYKNWEHMKFSMHGYKQVSPNEVQKSREDGWWGVPVEGTRK